jgi:hypothetical protein
MNKNQSNPNERGGALRWLVALLLLTVVSGVFAGTIYYGVDGSTGIRAKCKTTTAGTGVVVPNQVVEPVTASSSDVHAPTSNTAAVVTYAASASAKHVIYGLAWSYTGSGTLAGGNIKVEDVSGTTVFTIDIDAKGNGSIVFPRPLRGAAINTAMIVTLAAGGANVTGKVSVLGHTTE